jgi:hypothetical protein
MGIEKSVEAVEDGTILIAVEALECVDLSLLHLRGDSVGRRPGRRGGALDGKGGGPLECCKTRWRWWVGVL